MKVKPESKKSNPNRIKNLITKHKRFMKVEYERLAFQEPVILLIRNSGKVELYENATAGRFDYKHSDGTQREITRKNTRRIRRLARRYA